MYNLFKIEIQKTIEYNESLKVCISTVLAIKKLYCYLRYWIFASGTRNCVPTSSRSAFPHALKKIAFAWACVPKTPGTQERGNAGMRERGNANPGMRAQLWSLCQNCLWKLKIGIKLFLPLLDKIRALRQPKFPSQKIFFAALLELFCRIFGHLATVWGSVHIMVHIYFLKIKHNISLQL